MSKTKKLSTGVTISHKKNKHGVTVINVNKTKTANKIIATITGLLFGLAIAGITGFLIRFLFSLELFLILVLSPVFCGMLYLITIMLYNSPNILKDIYYENR